jgi:hypothetical protein
LSAGVDGKRVEKNEVEALPAAFRGGKPDFPAAATKRRRRRFLLFAAFRYAQATPFFPEFRICPRVCILASKTS